MKQDIIYEKLIRPVLFELDPENVHYLAASFLSTAKPLLPLFGLAYEKDDLEVNLFGSKLSNPIGLAAGFDKNATLADLLGSLGFGFAEIGSVCARPHGGNLRPRLFRLPEDRALINRMGLNGLGAEVVTSNLAKRLTSALPIGVNIAKTNDPRLTGEQATDDLVYTFECLKDLPLRYITINTSCPNTAEGCLTESKQLSRALGEMTQLNSRKLPLLVKLSPDSTDEFIAEMVELSIKQGIAGFVCGNTSIKRDGLATDINRLEKIGNGGLSGRPLKARNLALTQKVARLKTNEQIIIGVGGIESGADVYDYLSAGARAVQIYTGFIYRGPSAVKLICEELSQILQERGQRISSLISGS